MQGGRAPVESDRRGFTLIETLVASLVILIMLGTLAFAVQFFIKGMEKIESRRNALTIASSTIAAYDRQNRFPEPMEIMDINVTGGWEFTVKTTVLEITPQISELRVSVSGDNGTGIELTKRYYRSKP